MHVPGSPLRRLLALAVVALAAAALVTPTVGATTHRRAASARPLDAAAPLPYENPTLPVAQRVQDLLSRMTLAEKIGQMTQAERASVDTDTSKITTESREPALGRRLGADAQHPDCLGGHGRPLSAGGPGHAAAYPVDLRH